MFIFFSILNLGIIGLDTNWDTKHEMQLRNRNLTWKLLFLLLLCLPFRCHMLHYMHLKKFITAVAFARALGKRPTVLPIPIPIPIPIAQNEVIKLPMGGNTKTTILDGSKSSSQADAIAQLLGGGSTYAGTNKFGYALPSTNNHPSVINLSQLKGSDSNFINLSQLKGSDSNILNLSQLQGSDSNIINTLASVLGNGGQAKVLILGGGQNPMLGASPSVIHLNSAPGSEIMSQSNLMGSGLNYGGLNDLGFNGGLNFGDLGLGSSRSNVFQLPQNADKSRRNIQLTHRGRNGQSGNGHFPQKGSNSKPCENCRQPMNNGQRPVRDKFRNPPLSVKFTYRP